MINQEEWGLEREKLRKMIEIIKEQLQAGEGQEQKYRELARETLKEMREDASTAAGNLNEDMDLLIRLSQHNRERHVQALTFQFYQQQVRRLRKMYQQPYFGRIDFIEDGKGEKEEIYIGLATLFGKNEDCLIYDWRAPISSMFYDEQPGRVQYPTKLGPIQGEMTLKRQYKIENGQIQYMFNTNLKIDDEILQGILAKSTTGKMEHIVTSIQKEQNRIIRDDQHKLLVVQGAAGSGKTSIALHRVAYFLYTYRNTIRADNILVISPNAIFSDYISNVLPELGEENMRQITFQEYTEKELMGIGHLETVNQQLEYFWGSEQNSSEYSCRVQSTQFKLSQSFVQIIHTYLDYLGRMGWQCPDLVVDGEVILSRIEMEKLWRKNSYLPYAKRLKKMRTRILHLLRQFRRRKVKERRENFGKKPGYTEEQIWREVISGVRQDLKPVREKLQSLLHYNLMEMYLELYQNKELLDILATKDLLPDSYEEICQQTIDNLERGLIRYEDTFPLLLLKYYITGRSNLPTNIKYVLIDEAQDYSPLHYALIKELFTDSNLTLLGDVNQSIHPYMGIGNYGKLLEIWPGETAELIQLQKSYRSTSEISAFARQILPTETKVETVHRPGDKPRVIQVSSKSMADALMAGVENAQQQGAESVAIVCKTEAHCQELYQRIPAERNIHLMTSDNDQFVRDLVIVPAYLAKGLEFDAVLLPMTGEVNYQAKQERNLLYMLCTRALHHLEIYFSDQLSPLLAEIDQRLYQFIDADIQMMSGTNIQGCTTVKG